jgi:hypothetical protein
LLARVVAMLRSSLPIAVAVLLLWASVVSGVTREPLFRGEYGIQAAKNLSEYRSNFLTKAMPLFDATKQRWYHVNSTNQRWEDFYYNHVTCPPNHELKRVGKDGDGGKWMCVANNLRAPCEIFSLGSRMDFSFEEEMLKATPCHIHTFDCTVPGKSLDPKRHTFHKVCLGSMIHFAPGKLEGNLVYKSYAEIVSELGTRRVSILKMDIEWAEYQALGDLHEDQVGLPGQILLEVHYKEMMPLLFFHMANLGYGIASYEINPVAGPRCCVEYSFLRVEHFRAALR